MAEQSLDKHGAIAILIGIVGIVVTYVLWSISRNQATAPASTTGNTAGTVTVPSPDSSIQPFQYNGPSLPSSNINYAGPVNYTAPGGGIGYLTNAAPKSGNATITAKSGCGCGGDCGNNGPSCGSCDGSSLYTSPATQAKASVQAIQQAQAYTSSYQATPNYSLLQITPSSNQPVIAYAGA